ncbi:MAG: F0F1 ATP synthase subunit A [Deltaproteobacteria bacterium]|nr:F0F1 ATP synthase subunit A [Deltaproteobacteria bacterium]
MHEFSWFHLIPSVREGFAFLSQKESSWVLPTSWLVCLVLVGLALAARRGLDRARRREGIEALVPDARLTARNVMEIYVSALFDLAESTLGRADARRFFPLVGTLFIYILASNLMALVPGFLPPTSNFSANLSIALLVFLIFNVAGLVRNGSSYVKHLWGPVAFLAPFFLVLELISLCIRPVSLSLRLAGNLFGDHMVFGIMSDLVPPLVPIPFLGLGMFVSFIQALVFTLLSTVYISLAVAPGEEH